jgi:hypothetical protein
VIEIPPERRLSFQRIARPIDDAITGLEQGLSSQWPQRFERQLAARPFLRGTVLLSRYTYYSIILLCSEKPASPLRALSVPPMTRAILDSLFTVVFLFEDLPTRWEWFAKSAWREEHECFLRLTKKHGTDPAFTDWLSDVGGLNAALRDMAKITPQEEADPRNQIHYFPNPGGMVRQARGARQEYLSYLNDWFYRDLSAAAHLSVPGLAKRGGCLLGPEGPERDEMLDKHRSDYFFTAVTLLTSLLTELEIELGYGVREPLRDVWGALCPCWPEAEHLYAQRHQVMLGAKR